MEAIQAVFQRIFRMLAVQASPSHSATAAADTAVSIVLPAVPGKAHLIQDISWSYSAQPTGGGIDIYDGAQLVYQLDITAGGPGFLPVNKRGANGANLTVTLKAGSGTVVGKLNINPTM